MRGGFGECIKELWRGTGVRCSRGTRHMDKELARDSQGVSRPWHQASNRAQRSDAHGMNDILVFWLIHPGSPCISDNGCRMLGSLSQRIIFVVYPEQS